MREVADETFATGNNEDDKLRVSFEWYPMPDKAATAAAGRPIFKDTEFIRIQIPGDRDNIVFRPVREADKHRFAARYKHWKATGEGEGGSGTPLKEWPGVTRSQAEELSYFGVKTVEQLAGMTDGNLKNVGPLLALRQKAQDYLAAAAKSAPATKMRAELDAKGEEIAGLKAQLEMVVAELKAQKAEGKKAAK